MKKIFTLFFLFFTVSFSFTSSAQNVGIGTTSPLQKLHIGGAANTIRIDGIGSGGSFLTAPALSTNLLLYTNASGDISSIPAGTNGNIMTINGSGVIQWLAPATSGTLTSLTFSSPLTGGTVTTTGTVGISQANTSTDGYLSSTDWNTFNGKIGSLNGLTGITQTFANGFSGLTPAFNSTGTVHTLNIPMASMASVTAGLISNADYVSFSNQWSLAGNTFSVTDSSQFIGTTGALMPLIFKVGGQKAGKVNVGGITTFGYKAANANTAAAITAVGYQALAVNTSGTNNTAIGNKALAANTNGYFNTAIGDQALNHNTSAGNNTAVGGYALFTQSYANSGTAWNTENVAVGYQSMYFNQPNSISTGYQNTAIGTYSLYSNTTGPKNTACGYQALYNNTTGSSNTASGMVAMFTNSTGSFNTASGYSALYSTTSASDNSAFGYYALATTNGNDNSALGYYALKQNSSGTKNTAIGTFAGFPGGGLSPNANTSGSQNTYIGYNAAAGSSTQRTNSTAIGAYASVNANNSLVLGSINGLNGATANTNVGIGTNAPVNLFQVAGGNGVIQLSGTASQATTIITGTGFTAGLTGSTLVFSSGQTETVTYVSATQLTGSLSATVSATTFVIVASPVAGFNVTSAGNVGIGTTNPTASLDVMDGHIKSEQSGTTTIASSYGTASLTNATDMAGKISVTATAIAGTATVTFNKTFAIAPVVVLTPTNDVAAAEMASAHVYVTSTTTAFIINFGAAPSAAAHTYNYYVIETQ